MNIFRKIVSLFLCLQLIVVGNVSSQDFFNFSSSPDFCDSEKNIWEVKCLDETCKKEDKQWDKRCLTKTCNRSDTDINSKEFKDLCNQTELDKEKDQDKRDVDATARVFLDLTVFAIALYAFNVSKSIAAEEDTTKGTAKVEEHFSISKKIFSWSGMIYFMGAMVVAAMRLFWTSVDNDVASVSQDLANPDHILTPKEKESYKTKVEEYISNKKNAITYITIKMYLTYAVAAGWAVATVAAIVENILRPAASLQPDVKSVPRINSNNYSINKIFEFLINSSFATDLKDKKAKNTSPSIQQILILLLGTTSIVLELVKGITDKWSLLDTYPKTRIVLYTTATSLATLNAEKHRGLLEKLNREKETLETLLDTIKNKTTEADSKAVSANGSLVNNKLIDTNTVFSSNVGVTLPDCTTQTKNPACPIKFNEKINDEPPKLDELARSGMNIGVAKDLIGNLSAIGAASKSGNYNAGMAAILNSGAKNALASSLKTLKTATANYEKNNPKSDFKGKVKEEMKHLAGIYNKAIANNRPAMAQSSSSFPKGFDATMSEDKIDQLSDKLNSTDGLVKLDDQNKVLEKPKAAFTVNKAATDEDAKKNEIMSLFSGSEEEAKSDDQAAAATKTAIENQESPDLSSSEIITDPDKNLFKLLSVRYFKTVYPLVLDAEAVVEVKPPLAPIENSRLPASK